MERCTEAERLAAPIAGGLDLMDDDRLTAATYETWEDWEMWDIVVS